MARKKIAFGVVAGFVSTGAEALGGLITIPLLLHYLPPNVAGYWTLLITLGGLLSLAQCGLEGVVARRVAQSAPRSSGGPDHLIEEYAIIGGAYNLTSVILVAMVGVVYFTYLAGVISQNSLPSGSALAWVLYGVSWVVTAQSTRFLSIMDGLGEVGWDRVLRAVYAVLNLACHYVVLKMGFGVVGLAVTLLVLALARYVSSQQLLFRFRATLRTAQRAAVYNRDELKKIFSLGGKMLFLNVVGYFLNNIGIFVVEQHFGIDEVQKYNALMKVAVLVCTVSLLVPQMIYPYIAGAWSRGDGELLRRYYRNGVLASCTVAILASIAILATSRWTMPWWLGAGNYLGAGVLLPILIYAVIYVHHVTHATFTLACIGSGFIFSAAANALLAYPCIWLGVRYYGIAGVPLGLIAAVLLPTIAVVTISLQKVYFHKLLPVPSPVGS